jgi:hypothetical protein
LSDGGLISAIVLEQPAKLSRLGRPAGFDTILPLCKRTKLAAQKWLRNEPGETRPEKPIEP